MWFPSSFPKEKEGFIESREFLTIKCHYPSFLKEKEENDDTATWGLKELSCSSDGWTDWGLMSVDGWSIWRHGTINFKTCLQRPASSTHRSVETFLSDSQSKLVLFFFNFDCKGATVGYYPLVACRQDGITAQVCGRGLVCLVGRVVETTPTTT